jgi:hypothetical protein
LPFDAALTLACLGLFDAGFVRRSSSQPEHRSGDRPCRTRAIQQRLHADLLRRRQPRYRFRCRRRRLVRLAPDYRDRRRRHRARDDRHRDRPGEYPVITLGPCPIQY